MPHYHRAGEVPRVKHTTFHRADGEGLHREELVSSKGFGGIYSLKYRLEMPTGLVEMRTIDLPRVHPWSEAPLLPMHLLPPEALAHRAEGDFGGDFIRARRVLFQNEGCTVAIARVTHGTEELYRNARASEYLFIHRGRGLFKSDFGELAFEPGDQLVIPRAVTWRLEPESFDDVRLLCIESTSALEIPRAYRNEYGQLLEEAPYCERDFKLPILGEPTRAKGPFSLIIRDGARAFEQKLAHHPFDLVGWDGYLYPYALNVRDFHPKVGRIHLPPPVHAVLRSEHFVLCNFVPRPFDFHPNAVPAPYFHSNIDSDELLYYFGGEFMSRTGMHEGSITLHPSGLPHGPQPGRTEASLGQAGTEEWAVMLDTYSRLQPTLAARALFDERYPRSWLTKEAL